jgi:hypothetical protein
MPASTRYMGLGPVPAIDALEKAGLSIGEITSSS